MTGTLAVDGWAVIFGRARRAWAGWGPVQSPPRCTKCNSPPTNRQHANFIRCGTIIHSFIVNYAIGSRQSNTHNTLKIRKNRNKKSYKVTVPAKTLHTASLTYTQLFVSKSIPYLQPIAMNLFWCSLDSAYTVLDYLNSAFCTKILTYAGPLGRILAV